MSQKKDSFYKNKILHPNEVYINIDFLSIKKDIKSVFENVKDYGSSIIIDNGRALISVNNIGMIQVFYPDRVNMKNSEDMDISKIESIFKKQIPQFRIVQT